MFASGEPNTHWLQRYGSGDHAKSYPQKGWRYYGDLSALHPMAFNGRNIQASGAGTHVTRFETRAIHVSAFDRSPNCAFPLC
jgi:hypothetical protein